MVHSTTRNASYIHPGHDSILELLRTFPNGDGIDSFIANFKELAFNHSQGQVGGVKRVELLYYSVGIGQLHSIVRSCYIQYLKTNLKNIKQKRHYGLCIIIAYSE